MPNATRIAARLLASVGGLAAALLGGCASTPQPLRGDFYAPITPTEAALEHRTGAYVRWGGEILSVDHEEARTCFDVLARPLDSRAKPERTDAIEGRYRACASGFYDPAVFEEGRSITTTGTIEREATQKFDSFDLQVPVVAAEVVYLWPRRVYGAPPYLHPYYPYGWGWPYAYGWGPYWGPWIGAGWPGPYGYGYGWGYRYRRPYRWRGGAGHHGPSRAARVVRGGSRGNVGSGGGPRVPVGGR